MRFFFYALFFFFSVCLLFCFVLFCSFLFLSQFPSLLWSWLNLSWGRASEVKEKDSDFCWAIWKNQDQKVNKKVIVMSWHIVSCLDMLRHVLLCCDTLCYDISCPDMSYNVLTCWTVSSTHVVWTTTCPVLTCVMSCCVLTWWCM